MTFRGFTAAADRPACIKKFFRTRLSGTLSLAAAILSTMPATAQTIPATPSKQMRQPEFQSLQNELPQVREPEPRFDATQTYTLAALIDFAESHNPETRIAWEIAKQRANQLGVARAALYPVLAVAATAQQSRARVLFGDAFYRQDLTVLQPTFSLYYTLFDFGARRAGITTAEAGLLAADLAFNNTHRQIIFAVSAAYYRLTSAQAQTEAAQATLTNAQTVQAAVEERLNHGLATLPDALEARAATAQASYELETVRGIVRLAHGQLAEALGVPPTLPINVQPIPSTEIPSLTAPVEAFIDRALKQRPDLLAQVARVRSADAAIRSARSQYFPKVTFSGTTDAQFQYGVQPPNSPVSVFGPTWLAQLSARWTIFDGRARFNELERARSERRQAQAEITLTQDQIATEVWDAYSNIQTSLQRQEAAAALLSASEQSYNAAVEAYRYGVRNFLDVVSAQRTLAQARTAQVQSLAEVLTNFAQLAFQTGDLVSPTH